MNYELQMINYHVIATKRPGLKYLVFDNLKQP